MPDLVAEFLSQLQPDSWRERVGFSPDVEETNARLFRDGATEDEQRDALADWIGKHQPCLFGRLAARAGFLSYCILTPDDLRSSDVAIRAKIQAARRQWTRAGFAGTKNGFIILAVHKELAHALPNDTVKRLALRLCSLYLLDEAEPDKVLHDRICLEKPGDDRTTWEWLAGVNYFSAQGDRRWWHDHRIPGGMAFSVNSVGHMVKSGIMSKGMAALNRDLGVPDEGEAEHKVTSLTRALELAMRTINQAAETVSGKATFLLSLPAPTGGEAPAPPIPLTGPLAGKDWSQYFGHYHTDYTVPSEYFRPDVERPAELPGHALDFTYLFQAGVDNPAYLTMGEGRPIRHDGLAPPDVPSLSFRLARVVPQEVAIDSRPHLAEALREP
jgi:hypothetical protein